MLRKVLAASLFLILSVGVAFADEIRGVITKVDGDKVTFTEFKGKGQKGDEHTLTTAKDVKVFKGKRNQETKKLEAGEALEGGLKHKMFSALPERGVGALIITDSDKKITEIRVMQRRQKKE